MAFYIRKSISFGPIRFNISKSGIGTSVGIKGFRVGIRPNGKSYLHAGRHGVYYRQELGSPNNTGNKETYPLQHTSTESLTITKYNTACSKDMAPVSRKDLLSKLNKSYRSFRFDYFFGIGFTFLSFFVLPIDKALGAYLTLVGLVITLLVAHLESSRRTVVITYDFEDENAYQFRKIVSAVNELDSNCRIWSLVSSKDISGTHESKLNAGAGSLVSKAQVQIGEGKPPWVETNVTIPVIKTRGQALYLMPDGILVYDSSGVGYIEYNEINSTQNTTNFIEDYPPRDAKIVDTTWKHPNKNGGPDRRFSDNYQISICLYGELKIKSSSGLYLYLMTSKHDSPEKFINKFDSAFKDSVISEILDLPLPELIDDVV